jgi:hypothetical protein
MPRGQSPEECIKTHIRMDGECWMWSGKILKPGMGYGLASQHAKWQLAHRLSYKTFVGDIPEGMQVLHRCDRPACVNPSHLFLGTQKENIHDMLSKDRRLFTRDRRNGRFVANG